MSTGVRVRDLPVTFDCTLTVAVSIAAGTAALTSAFPRLVPAPVPICLAMMCPRSGTYLTYMINIALTTEFSLAADGGR